jgi:hypothetical protein
MWVSAMSEHKARLGHLSRQLALGCALACAASLAGQSAARAEDVITGVMNVFGISNEKDSIDYRERSPLVIPPSRSLPLPERAAAETNPAWPIDPEIKAAADAAKDHGRLEDEDHSLSENKLTPGRIVGQKGKSARRTASNADVSPRGTDGNGAPLRPDQLGGPSSADMFSKMFKRGEETETGKFVAEPPRASLTDPPAGYQTPSVAAAYGLGKDNTPAKAVDYQTTHGTTDSN